MKTLRWIRVLVVNGFEGSKILGLRCPTIILRRALAVAFLFMFVGLLISYASDDLELIRASEKGDIAKVTSLLAQGADVNAKNNDGETALMGASLMSDTKIGPYIEVVKTLLSKGADVNAKNNKGRTALMLASMLGRSEILQLLKKAGVKE